MSKADAPDLEALSDLCTPWCLRVAVTLRIAEHITEGTTDIGGLAAAAGCDAEALHQLLAYLAGKGVFERTAPGHFALNDAARGLLDPGARLGLGLEGIGGRMAYAWGTLIKYVRTGEPAYHELFGLPFFDDLDAHPELGASFDALIGPAGHGAPSPDFEIAGGWESVRTVVDVGGGTGAMLAEILRVRPQIHGILVDRPQTVARSAAIFQAAGVSGRVTTVGRSFFDPLPAGGDVYLLKGIVNDWPDRQATRILSRCAEAARPAGRVIVLGGVRRDDAVPPLEIETVLLGGKVRTLAQLRELARAAGLDVTAAGRQSSGYFVTECRPIMESKRPVRTEN